MRIAMPSLTLLSLCVIVSGTVASTATEATTPNFDQGIDSSGFLRRVQSEVLETDPPAPLQGREVYLPKVTIKAKFTSPAATASSALPGIKSGGFLDAIRNHSGYWAASQYVPLIREKPPEVSEPLLRTWDEIEFTKGILIEVAAGLETRRDDIVRDGEELDRKAADLNDERDALNQEIDDYNGQCAGRPRTPTCDTWRAELVRKKADLERRIARHNENFEKWKKVLAAFNDDAQKHNAERTSWGERIKNFVQSAQRAIESEEICAFKRVDRTKLKCQYHCQIFVNGIPMRDLGWWEMDWDGVEGSCANFEDRENLERIFSGPSWKFFPPSAPHELP